jgi:uncharacterized membrane protein
MNAPNDVASADGPILTNGSGAAAILAAGIGCLALAVLACAADKSAAVRSSLVFYRPTGPLSGVTTVAILIWLAFWGILEWRWRSKSVNVTHINAVALALLVVSLVLTFPPVADLL